MTKPDTTKTRRKPNPATLLVHLEDYMADNDIGSDASITSVLDRLGDSIIKAETNKVRSN